MKGLLHQLAYVFVPRLGSDQSVALEDAPGVGVHDENRVSAGIEQDGVGGFRTYAVERQQFFPQLIGRLCEHPLPANRHSPRRDSARNSSGAGLSGGSTPRIGSSWPAWARVPGGCHRRLSAPSVAQPAQGPFHVRPGRVLGQERPHDDLEASVGRPPVLRPPRRHQCLVVSPEARRSPRIGTHPIQFSGPQESLAGYVDKFCQWPIRSVNTYPKYMPERV